MLNLVSLADIGEPTVVRSRMGILLDRAHMPVPRGDVKELAGPARASAKPVAAKAFARPQGSTRAALFGIGAQVAGSAKFAGQQPISKVNYAHTTRIAALKGSGALGPHPARDPV
jgi:hypothetical protein